MSRLRTEPRRGKIFNLRLFQCRACGGLFLSAERWIGKAKRRYIMATPYLEELRK